MGRLIYSMSISLDGFAAAADGSLDWVRVDEELHASFNEEGRELGTSLYGRRMYELMAGYWPSAEEDPAATPMSLEWARIWKATPKVVFSRTLEHVDGTAAWSGGTPWRRSPGSRRTAPTRHPARPIPSR